ncbi:MAG: M24 family metallopeptidase [Gammaproteobacteria bacterium]|nr:M24 family metallopeptidase [Gammaproteobacteria bacterium]
MTRFISHNMPARFCNFERLLERMEANGLDGLVASTSNNVFYLSGFNALAQKSDEPRPFAFVLSRHDPEHPILVLPDYYLGAFSGVETWVEDFRPYRGVLLPFDTQTTAETLLRFVPETAHQSPWVQRAAKHYAGDMVDALHGALADIGLTRGRIGFDDLRLGAKIESPSRTIADAYAVLMSARSVKTPAEIQALRAATAVNRTAIESCVNAWTKGMTYRDLNHVYDRTVVDLGGHVHDPGAMVFFNGGGHDPYVSINMGNDDFELEPGMRIMFDCHGTLGLYCWDGGKTWVVGQELDVETKRLATVTADAMTEVENAMRPGARISELQALGQSVFRKSGLAGADDVFVFFHGLGLSHLDQELMGSVEGSATGDWILESDMLVATHILYPGGDRERMWLEDIGLITATGAEPFFGWDFMPHVPTT